MTPFYAQDHDYSQFNVLAVDDIPLNLLLVQKMLAKFNFTLRTAANGQQALDAATADIQIVILSALNSNEDVVKGFNLGANDFIMKPIIMEKLLSCVNTQMQQVASKRAK